MQYTVCSKCGVSFRSFPSNPRRYCSRDCYRADQHDRLPEATCPTCGSVFRKKPGRPLYRHCSVACRDLTGPRKADVDHRIRTAKGHPIAPPSGLVAEARLVLYDKIGPGPHRCHWCGAEVDWKRGLSPGALIADHLNHDRTDDHPENLVPSCNACNAHRTRSGDRRRIVDGEDVVMAGKTKTRAVRRSCESCGGELLVAPAEVRRGRGRFCSRSCARRAPRSSR